jgi:hypothetical protein
MLSNPDREHFIHAQLPEIQGLLKKDVFYVKHISENPAKARLLISILRYKRKHSPIGTILKHKAQLCVNGSQQEYGRDF